ncbi:MAG: tRNA-(ms[2]io[6]A)-hydroxylase [Proteobacteria bacterium]|nr:tRNA-(ms[2]io[6]A)-hydroxylase [Pseudomonadota bacterium]
MNLAALLVPTPERWLQAACADWHTLLVDHANCEKKAASTALALIFAYPERSAQNLALARLAREELRHFEQVTRMMERLGVRFERLKPGRYAAGLRAALRTHEPHRHLDLLLAGAIIEARSCERFERLAQRLPEPLAAFYGELQRAEARHTGLYLELAAAATGDFRRRLHELLAVEAGLIERDDAQLRFHSGPPAAAAVPAADVTRGNVSSS